MEQKKTYIADLHIHSKYSRATSREATLAPGPWARYKGVDLVGTGDFTHAKWREELKESFGPRGRRLLYLERGMPPSRNRGWRGTKTAICGYRGRSALFIRKRQNEKGSQCYPPTQFGGGDKLAHRLEAIGNLHSDGRPILGLDCRDLLEITLESCPEAVFIPAHIWTPHFSLFGAFSGFDTIEECFEDLTPLHPRFGNGLSSDPPMNRRVSALDRFTLVSNSDAHSPMKLAREAT